MRRFTVILLFYIFASSISAAVWAGDTASADGGAEKELSQNDLEHLENGYALLYSGVSGLSWTDELLLIKFESDPVEQFVKALAKASAEIKAQLETFAESASWLDLEETGLPEIEQRKQSAVLKDRIKSFMPLVGRSQANFERTLLLSNSGALNQMQHLAEVLLNIEKNADRRKFLSDARDTFSSLYEDDIELLNHRYFCDNTADESKEMR